MKRPHPTATPQSWGQKPTPNFTTLAQQLETAPNEQIPHIIETYKTDIPRLLSEANHNPQYQPSVHKLFKYYALNGLHQELENIYKTLPIPPLKPQNNANTKLISWRQATLIAYIKGGTSEQLEHYCQNHHINNSERYAAYKLLEDQKADQYTKNRLFSLKHTSIKIDGMELHFVESEHNEEGKITLHPFGFFKESNDSYYLLENEEQLTKIVQPEEIDTFKKISSQNFTRYKMLKYNGHQQTTQTHYTTQNLNISYYTKKTLPLPTQEHFT